MIKGDEMLEELVKTAQSLVKKLNEGIASVSEERKEIDSENLKLTERQDVCSKKENSINDREAAVEKFESPAIALSNAKQLNAQTKDLQSDLSKGQIKLDKEKRDFSQYVFKMKQEIQTAQDEVYNERESFKAARKELEEKEKTYKDDILNKLKAVK